MSSLTDGYTQDPFVVHLISPVHSISIVDDNNNIIIEIVFSMIG